MKADLGRFYRYVPKDPLHLVRWRRDVLESGYKHPDLARELWIMCARDLLFYVNAFCWTFNPKDYSGFPDRLFNTWPDQDGLLRALAAAIGDHDLAVPKSREMGASWLCLVALEWRWHFWEGQTFLLCSRKDELVDKTGSPKSLFWKIDYLHRHQPRWLLPRRTRLRNHLENIDNGSVMDGEATVPDLGRGDRLTAIFLDEAAFMPNAHLVARATRDATKCRIMNSTFNGTGGIGHEFYQCTRNPSWTVYRLHWSKHPEKRKGLYTSENRNVIVLDKDNEWPEGFEPTVDGKIRSPWYDYQCRRANSDREIAEELDIDPWGSGEQFFRSSLVLEHKEKHVKPPYYRGNLIQESGTGLPKWVDDPHGSIKLWATLHPKTNEPYGDSFAVACDIAAGGGGDGASNSCIAVIDKRTGQLVASYASNEPMPSDFADLAILVATWFKRATLNWENNGGFGKQFRLRVLQHGYMNLYLRNLEDKIVKEKTVRVGYWTPPDGPIEILGELQRAMKMGEIKIPDEDTLEEMGQFVWKNGRVVHDATLSTQDESGKGKAHGDRVIALALAWETVKDYPVYDPPEKKPECEPGSIGWYINQDDEYLSEKSLGENLLVFS